MLYVLVRHSYFYSIFILRVLLYEFNNKQIGVTVTTDRLYFVHFHCVWLTIRWREHFHRVVHHTGDQESHGSPLRSAGPASN